MLKKAVVFFFACFILMYCSSPGQKTILKDVYKEYFHAMNAEGTIIIYDLHKNTLFLYNKEQSTSGILPASTFKIYNALIALETKVAPSKDFVIEWDGIKYQYPDWNNDHTLESAFKNSVVWYFQELARRIGKQKMGTYINELHYGNMDISQGIDTFWLEGGLKISAKEQLDLLVQLYENKLPFSKSSQETVKEMMILEKNQKYILRGKTGTVSRLAGVYYSWFVGYLEQNNNVYFFTTNLQKAKTSSIGVTEAKDITLQILKGMKLL
ncbi:MAG: class D beta-lactamase [Spirochaetales bacterium]|nr:class D beta-lactamase [Spirochaetales bacterium]